MNVGKSLRNFFSARDIHGRVTGFEASFAFIYIAEAVRFELTIPFGMPPFQGGALDRYATPPDSLYCSTIVFFSRYPFGCFKYHSRFIASDFVPNLLYK